MARHLSEIQAKTRLNLGKSVAQFLGYWDEPNYTVLKWLTISSGDEGYAVTHHEVFDEGSEDELGIGEFSRLDPENLPYGVADEFDTVEEALAFATVTYSASVQQYVTESMIDMEYADYLKRRNGTNGQGAK